MAGPRSEPPMPMLTTRRKGCAGAALDAALAHTLRKGEHARALGHHGLLDVGAAERRTRRLPQRHVQHGAVLGGVDLLAAPHGLDPLAQTHRIGELEELRERDLIEPLAGEIHQQPGVLAREALEAPRIALEQLLHRHRREPRGVRVRAPPTPGYAGREYRECHQRSPCLPRRRIGQQPRRCPARPRRTLSCGSRPRSMSTTYCSCVSVSSG